MKDNNSYSPFLGAIHQCSQQYPDKSAIITTDGHIISYSSLWINIQKAAKFLQDNHVKKGDRIILSSQKEIGFVYFYFANHYIGGINVVVDNNNSQEHNYHIAKNTTPKLAFGIHFNDILSFSYDSILLPESDYNINNPEYNPSDIADIMFTSGTTGKPKGVILSHFNIVSSAKNINSFIKNRSQDIEFLGLPICHSFGLGRLRCNLLLGSTLVFHNGFANLKSVFENFEKYKITGFGMVPAIWAYIKRFSGTKISKFANQIKYIEIGSASMPLEDKRILSEIFPNTRICMHYGLTEASRSTFLEFHKDFDHLDSVGSPVVSEISVDIFNEFGQAVPENEEGEICISGNMVTKSYFNSKDNINAFWNDFFRTGDWGYKKDGYVYLVSRKKDLINIGGKKVSPIEIEEAAEKLGCRECLCISVKDPNGILGEVPKLLLEKGSFNKSIEEIKNGLKNLLEPYKVPKLIEIIDNIPKTENGKKKRNLNV